jgi:hypothetical protein
MKIDLNHALQRVAIFLSLGLGGCAVHSADIPSLRPRPIEQVGKSMVEEPVSQAIPLAASDPARVDKVKQLLTKARGATSAFQAAVDQALPIVRRAAGAAKGSENWVAAQVALGRVEINRAPVKAALSDLDEQRRIVLFSPPSKDQAMVEDAVREVEAIDVAQERTLNALIKSVDRQ